MAGAGSLSGLINFINKTYWADVLGEVLAEHFEPACHDCGVEMTDLPEFIDDGHAMTLWGCALEDLMAREFENDGNVVDDYLKRRGHLETGVAKRYMKALRGAVMSLYEVSDVIPETSFLARDLIRGGDPVRVFEKSGTRTLKNWDRLAARLVQLGPDWQMGGGVLLFDRDTSDLAVSVFREMNELGPDDIREFADRRLPPVEREDFVEAMLESPRMELAGPTFTGIWLANALDRALNPQLPTLTNTDGDPIVMCTSVFSLVPGTKASQCRTALAEVAGFAQETPKFFNWVRDTGTETKQNKAPKVDDATVLITSNERGQTILGSVEIKKAAITLSTNSRARAAEGEGLIMIALEGLAGPPVREEMTAEKLLAERGKKKRPGKSAKMAAGIPPDEAREVIHSYMDQHYRKILDEPIPLLNGLTPRQASVSKDGREDVIGWLKVMENKAAKTGGGSDPMASYDFTWIWRELDLAKFRI